MKTLVLFDFDGTLTNGDSLVEFLKKMVGYKQALIHLPEVLVRWFWLAVTGKISHASAKETLLKVHMRKRTHAEWDQAVREFNGNLQPDYFNGAVIGALRAHRDAGADVAIVSASIDTWLSPFAEEEGVALICTRSRWEEEYWAGFSGENCRGMEKVRRIREAFPPEQYEQVIAYGNTRSDYPMLSLANEAWLVQADGSLRRWTKGKAAIKS